MAQTIALQRGSTAITWNGTTLTTLFTQSGGTATRVCIGGVSAYTSVSSGIAMAMFVKQSAVSVYTTVAIKSSGTQVNNYALDFYGGQAIYPQAMKFNTASTPSTSSVIASTNTANYTGLNNMNGMAIYGADTVVYAGASTTANYDVCPAQFWIGPGDSVVMKFFNNNDSSATGNVAYSFTTITES
jgi:hypothetical protein